MEGTRAVAKQDRHPVRGQRRQVGLPVPVEITCRDCVGAAHRGNRLRGRESSRPVPAQERQLVAVRVRNAEIGLPVPVEIGGGDRERLPREKLIRRARRLGETARSIPEQDLDSGDPPGRVRHRYDEVRPAVGVPPTATGDPGAAVKPPAPLPIRIATARPLDIATARSGAPSPLKSALASEQVIAPAGSGGAVARRKPPAPSPSRTLTSLSVIGVPSAELTPSKQFVTARSSL